MVTEREVGLQHHRLDEEWSGGCVSLSGWAVTVSYSPAAVSACLICSYGKRTSAKCFHTTAQRCEQMCDVCSPVAVVYLEDRGNSEQRAPELCT